MPNTTWSPTDKSATVALTGSNLIATSSSGGSVNVRAIDKQATGKFYWECTLNVFTGTNSGVGTCVGTLAIPFGITAATSQGEFFLNKAGQVLVDSVAQGSVPSFGTIAAGTVVCIAIDGNNALGWFRLGAAGNWNMSASANPATGVGGVSIVKQCVAIPFYPAAAFAASGDQITANFGDSAFTGAVPAGFTSGFTAGASVPTNALATQIAAEHWFTTNPDMQLTQVALEHWATVTGTGLQAIVTQIALEQWASVASVSATPPQARAWVMA